MAKKARADQPGRSPLENLGDKRKPQWKKGQSGNPKGLPKGTKHGLRATLKAQLLKRAPAQVVQQLEALGWSITKRDVENALAMVLVSKGLTGELDAIQEVFRQLEEPLKTAVEHSGPGGTPLGGAQQIVYCYPDNGRGPKQGGGDGA